MTYFTPLADGQDGNAANLNAPLTELDTAIENVRDGTLATTLLRVEASTTLTISSGAVTATKSYHVIAAETGTTDDLDTITAAQNNTFIVISADTGDTITVKNGTGNIYLPGGDMDMSGSEMLLLFYDGTNWIDFNSAASGGTLGALTDVSSAPATANYVLATPDGSPGDYSGRALVVNDLPFYPAPRRTELWHDEAVVITGNALAHATQASQRYNTYSYQNAGANGDEFEQAFFLRAGTYDFKALGATTSTSGLIDWYMKASGGSYGSAFETGQDWYSGATTYNVIQTASSVTVASDGVYVIKGKVNGKNGSSTGYYITLTKYWFIPNGGY